MTTWKPPPPPWEGYAAAAAEAWWLQRGSGLHVVSHMKQSSEGNCSLSGLDLAAGSDLRPPTSSNTPAAVTGARQQ